MTFKKKLKIGADIPQTSTSDLVFILLIFFMVSTVFKESTGLKLILPDAKKIEKLPGKRSVTVLWADRAGRITIDDAFLSLDDISNVVYKKAVDPLNPLKVVSLKIDKDMEMGKVQAIQEELRTVGGGALNVNYSSRSASD